MNDPAVRSGPLAARPRVRYGGDDTNSVNASGATRIGGKARLVDASGNPLPGGAPPAGPSSGAAAAGGMAPGPAPAGIQPPQRSGQMVPGRSAGSMVFKPDAPQPQAGPESAAAQPQAGGYSSYPGSRGGGGMGMSPGGNLPPSSAAPGQPSPRVEAWRQGLTTPGAPGTPTPGMPRPPQAAAGNAARPPKNFEGHPSLQSWKDARDRKQYGIPDAQSLIRPPLTPQQMKDRAAQQANPSPAAPAAGSPNPAQQAPAAPLTPQQMRERAIQQQSPPAATPSPIQPPPRQPGVLASMSQARMSHQQGQSSQSVFRLGTDGALSETQVPKAAAPSPSSQNPSLDRLRALQAPARRAFQQSRTSQSVFRLGADGALTETQVPKNQPPKKDNQGRVVDQPVNRPAKSQPGIVS